MPETFFYDGARFPMDGPGFAAAVLCRLGAPRLELPKPGDPPYLFCGNGSCRDCNLLIDGFADLPSCRVPLAPGMSLRSGEGAGGENALSRNLAALHRGKGEPLVTELAIAGAGPAGRAAASEARRGGIDVLLLEARRQESEGIEDLHPVGVREGELLVMASGETHELRARAVILANGARDSHPAFPGSNLAGVLPVDLLERYLVQDHLPGERVAIEGELRPGLAEELSRLGSRWTVFIPPGALEGVSGSTRVESVRWSGSNGDVEVDLVFVRGRREPALELAKALGCRTFYDRSLRCEKLVADSGGATTVSGVFAAGDLLQPGSEERAAESGRRAARAALSFLGAT